MFVQNFKFWPNWTSYEQAISSVLSFGCVVKTWLRLIDDSSRQSDGPSSGHYLFVMSNHLVRLAHIPVLVEMAGLLNIDK